MTRRARIGQNDPHETCNRFVADRARWMRTHHGFRRLRAGGARSRRRRKRWRRTHRALGGRAGCSRCERSGKWRRRIGRHVKLGERGRRLGERYEFNLFVFLWNWRGEQLIGDVERSKRVVFVRILVRFASAARPLRLHRATRGSVDMQVHHVPVQLPVLQAGAAVARLLQRRHDPWHPDVGRVLRVALA